MDPRGGGEWKEGRQTEKEKSGALVNFFPFFFFDVKTLLNAGKLI